MNPPYYLIRRPPWGRQQHGPFSSHLDAALAKMIAKRSWIGATIMDKDEFGEYTKEKKGG